MISNNAKLVLTLFAYLPLFFVIAIRNLDFVKRLFGENSALSIELYGKDLAINIDIFNLFLIELLLFFILFHVFKHIVKTILNEIEKLAPREIEVQIKSEKNTEMLGLLLTYIVPFCITFENGLYDLFAFCILIFLLLYVYIDTSLFCINPLLNFCFGYNIYKIEMHNRNNFMLSTKKHRNEMKKIILYNITDDLWIEK